MGEEQKKPEQKKEEEVKKGEEGKGEENPKVEKEKPSEEKNDEKKTEESKEAPPPLPPPQEIVLQVYMHCEGCARKVRRCLKGFQGVEDVQTDCKTHKVVVKGEKADPLKVLERVQRKSHRQVVLLSPIPKPPAAEDEPKRPEDKEVKPEEKKEEPQVIIVVLSVHMHCEACAQEIKKRIQKMKGVERADSDLKSSQVTVKGVFEPPKLVEFIHKRTGKQAVIVKVESPEKKEGEKPNEGKEEKKTEESGGEKEAKKGEDGSGKEKKEGGEGGGEEQPPPPPPQQPLSVEAGQLEDPKLELRKNEFHYYQPQNYQYYPQTFVQQEMYAYPPQIFSDENPNACSIM